MVRCASATGSSTTSPPKDRDIAMVFQSYALYPHMTVRDNLAFGLKLRKVAKPEIEKRVNDAAGILQLEKLLDRKPKELSGGQRQRVALGRAIVREPAVFLMDEPLSNLDAKLRVQTRAEIARLHQRLGTTMVYVTHDQVEAMTMGQRIAVMSEGLLQQVGTPQQLYDTPVNRFVAGFIGSPSMNFVGAARAVRRGVRADRWLGDDPDPPALPRGPPDGRRQGHRGLPAGAPRARRRPGPASATLQGTADVVEYLGNEELLHVTVGGREIVAIVGLVAQRSSRRRRPAAPPRRQGPPVQRRDRRVDGPSARGRRGLIPAYPQDRTAAGPTGRLLACTEPSCPTLSPTRSRSVSSRPR